MVQATSQNQVCAFIEFELIKLAERINVSGNLTDGQIQLIARDMVQTYPNETIADFKICFERASTGHYGKVFKLDGIEVGLWFKAYLDEKYRVLEDQLMKEKDDYHNKAVEQSKSTDWLQLWKEAIAGPEPEKQKSQNIAYLQHLRAMTPSEIERNGQEKPPTSNYPSASLSELQKWERHHAWIRTNFDFRTGEKLPTWIHEEEFNKQYDAGLI